MANSDEQRFASLPEARRGKNWKTRLFWLIPIAAAALAGYFIYSDLVSHGPTLAITFENAAGLEAGKSSVKYRGAEVGAVTSVRLTKDRAHVVVTVALDGSAKDLAREGSRFWVVKPEIGIAQIRGLRTIVSGDYITVEPGNGKPQTRFNGLSETPVVDQSATLNIVLLSERAGSLKERSPVFYRGIPVGEIIGVELGPESQVVQARVHIHKHFAPLVRMNSKFWNSGGINITLGLSGADISAQSAQSLLSGGVSFATPDEPGPDAREGTSFRVYDKPEEEWLAWAPAIRLNHHSSSPAPH